MTDQGSGEPGAMTATPKKPTRLGRWFKSGGVMRRTFSNAGRLLSGKAVAGLLGLSCVALAARALGPEQFGALILIHTYVLVVSGIVKFRSWQAVIRYGAECLGAERRGDFQKLIKFTTLLDVGSSVLGAVAAVLLAPLVGGWFGWDAETSRLAASYGWLILFMVEATPTGVLRLFDRFNLLAVQSTIAPFLRLLGAVAAYLAGAGLAEFLAVWFIAAATGRLVLLVMGWSELRRQNMTAGLGRGFGQLTTPHEGLWKFVWFTNFNASLGLMLGNVTTLVVGATLGATDAGLFKIAREFSSVLGKPAQLLTQAIYPDLTRLWSDGDRKAAGKLILRSGLVAGAGAFAVLALIVLVGEQLLSLVVGEAFIGAYGIMVLLVSAKVISVFGFPLTPAMYAMGRPGLLLRINVVLTLLYLPLLVGLLEVMGRTGAGAATLVWAFFTFAVTALTVARLLGRRPKPVTA
ncbi:MAG: lipopolysaccharide biosynthesis protein [Rhodospirillales bacterium]|nr:lipopolysaccharide biosynthesis protein [Rhodospirillales bacterium]